MQKLVMRDLMKAYPHVNYFDKDDLIQSMSDIYDETGAQFVIVIDEWDAVFREWTEDKEGQKVFLDFLRDWLKNKDYVALAYMTGILPIKKYGKHSALNMFDEYSMLAPLQLAEYTGFTESEVETLCENYHMTYNEISDWYDGYKVCSVIPVDVRDKYRAESYRVPTISIYSPLSVVKAVSTGVIRNYWNDTETYEALAEYIRMNLDGLKDAVVLMMDGGRIKIDISGYENDMTTFHGRDDVLTLLVHLGYLSYEAETHEVFIPNNEVLDEFKTSTKSSDWVDTFASFKTSLKLLDAIWAMDAETTAELFELAHDRTANKTYNSESALSYGVQYALYAAQKYYTTIQELDSGKGYADLVYLPAPSYEEKPALLVELKYNKSAKTAADQIKDKNYPQILEHYKGNILLVAVNYDKENKGNEFKKHSCSITRV